MHAGLVQGNHGQGMDPSRRPSQGEEETREEERGGQAQRKGRRSRGVERQCMSQLGAGSALSQLGVRQCMSQLGGGPHCTRNTYLHVSELNSLLIFCLCFIFGSPLSSLFRE